MTLLEEIKQKREKFIHMKLHFKDFVERETVRLAQEIVITEIVKRMMNAGFSRKIWENTDATKAELRNNIIKVYFKSEYFSETGFDVALAREFGTSKHMIRPDTKQALSWIFQGKRMFSKGHEVEGIESLKIITNTLKDKKPELQNSLNLSLLNWREKILNT